MCRQVLFGKVCASPAQPPRSIYHRSKYLRGRCTALRFASGAPLTLRRLSHPLRSQAFQSLRGSVARSPPRFASVVPCLPPLHRAAATCRRRAAFAFSSPSLRSGLVIRNQGSQLQTGFVPQPPFCSAARPHGGWWRTVSLPSLRSFVPHSASLNPGLPASFN